MEAGDNTYEKNEIAFRQMKAEIDAQYPEGHFLAFEEGRIVADAPTYEKLMQTLVSLGKDHPEIFVVRAGSDYPEYGAILTGT